MIYFIKPVGHDGPIKIGFASSASCKERMECFSRWSPLRLELVLTIEGDAALERNLHDCLFPLHSHGEWFHAGPMLTNLIDALKAGTPVAEAIDLSKRIGCIHSAAIKAGRQRSTQKAIAS